MSSANARLVMPASTAAASRVLMRFMLSPEFAKDQIIQPDTGRRALCGPHLRLGAASRLIADGRSSTPNGRCAIQEPDTQPQSTRATQLLNYLVRARQHRLRNRDAE